MNTTIDLNALEKAAAILHDIEPILDKLNAAYPALQLLEKLGDDAFKIINHDCFITSGEAAKMLGISSGDITSLVNHKFLTPYYVNSHVRKFKLSEVKALPSDKPCMLRSKDRQ